MQEPTIPEQQKATDRTAPRSGRGLGTESSNTVPSNCNSSCLTKILRTGIDSLYLTFRGELDEGMFAKLGKLKQLAQSSKDSDKALAQCRLGSHVFEVHGNGRNPFAFILEDACYRIEVAKLGAKLVPLVYCQIRSEFLTRAGYPAAVSELREVVAQIGKVEGPPNVSRVDICADFTTEEALELITEAEFVTKARSFDRHTVSRQFSGFSFSIRSPLSARLYNKSLEIACKGRDRSDLFELWRTAGWDGVSDVWRLEFQYRRAALRSLNIVTYHDLVNDLSGLWEYSTTKWLRHTIPSRTDTTQSRWPTSPFWEALQAADWPYQTHNTLVRIALESCRRPSEQHLFINGLSPLTSYSALKGIDDPMRAIDAYLDAARDFHDERASETGIDFENYFRQKVENKRRTYNTALNEPLDASRHPGDIALTNDLKRRARDYRRAKDGD